ncbi:PREDICTED: zinc finger CCCH domain-containing protein 34-like isoform X2 [Lupinus angustifolius]|uniref:zinc finger CCCH domain-containing protein 34-like isoform X1 n=1 Tax=Lupinus angustifolius TaxID=3871 RepID=UPI00092F5040|nr:PREDICTED: zinc finger CCCH domain-containing protein 34-like isoform X1 [Lupinus angustifolius]XP_019464377.1 PREDICTED: zinc finger CCCH domain-containing protein 34-like isoform X2 [Lupinus angustifolius]
MERYGRASEGSHSDPSPEWGYQELSWQGRNGGAESYPQRPDEADCIYFLKNGFCGYGSRCRFNHPCHSARIITGAARTGVGEYPERVGQPVCQYYMRTGSCKFGPSCKYHHPRQGAGIAAHVSLNYYGYPLRTGEKECSYYVKTGQCKFGTTCKFHHPQPVGVQIPAPSPVPPVSPLAVPVPSPLYQTVQSPSGPSSQQYGVLVARPSLLPGSLVQGPYGPMVVSPTMVPFSGWGPYQGPATSPVHPSSTASNVGSTQLYGITQIPSPTTAYAGPYQPSGSLLGPSGSGQKEHSLPERPDQPECQYYMKTGECKFGPSCRYHHPADMSASKTNVIISPVGLPLRPGASVCTHYTQRGVCKFGPTCKFDHPMGSLSYSPSASSLTDMPVAPYYSVGYSHGTLAPSSSSSELRHEPTSGSSKEPASSRMSSSMSTPTGSVGLTLSSGGPVSQSGTQASVQSSSCLATTDATMSSTVSYTSI